MSRDSALVVHAKRELKLAGFENAQINAYVKVVTMFETWGGHEMMEVVTLGDLMWRKPLTELTTDPDEWHCHEQPEGFVKGIWQNRRAGYAFSDDGGVTYYRLDEPANPDGTRNFYKSKEHVKA